MTKWLPKPKATATAVADKWPLPDKPAAGWKFPTGAYLKDEKGIEYYATPAQAEAYQDRADDKTVNDAEFWDWFRQFRTNYYIYPVSKWTGKGKGKGLSGWWQYDLHSAYGSASSNIDRRLSLALRAVGNVVRVVDDSTPAYTVDWASEGTSSTDIAGKRIIINPKPITKPGKLTSAESIDITTAFGLHEAGHAKYTSQVHGPLLDAKPDPWSVSMFLANVIEDPRTEGLTSKEYPGFAGYFPLALDYMWNDMVEDTEHFSPPEKWGQSLKDCLNAVVLWVKWPEKSEKYLTDPSFAEEQPWWTDWNARYQRGEMQLLPAVLEALERIKQSSDEVEQEMQARAEYEKAQAEMNEAVEALKGLLEACVNGHTGEQLDGETAEEVRRAVQEGLREWKPKQRIDGLDISEPTIWVSHPLEDSASKHAYIGKPSGVIDRLRSVLQFRPEKPRWADRLLKTGTLDEEQLYRFGLHDYRMFEQQVVETYPNAQVSLLADMSGSMMGSADGNYLSASKSKVMVAQELAQLFVSALSGMTGVTPKVFGHTGDLREGEGTGGSAEFYELWEPGERIERLGLISSMEHGDNFDGFAIEWCVQELLDRGGLEDQRLLIVLSDGEPAGYDYDGYECMNHVRRITDWAEKQGVFVLQVAIDPHMRSEHQSQMFKNWVPYVTPAELPRQLSKVLISFLNR